MKRIIVVAGATGMQGGSVVRSLLNSDLRGQGFGWHIRALTRDENSSKVLPFI